MSIRIAQSERRKFKMRGYSRLPYFFINYAFGIDVPCRSTSLLPALSVAYNTPSSPAWISCDRSTVYVRHKRIFRRKADFRRASDGRNSIIHTRINPQKFFNRFSKEGNKKKQQISYCKFFAQKKNTFQSLALFSPFDYSPLSITKRSLCVFSPPPLPTKYTIELIVLVCKRGYTLDTFD